jgi:hypothetical protein
MLSDATNTRSGGAITRVWTAKTTVTNSACHRGDTKRDHLAAVTVVTRRVLWSHGMVSGSWCRRVQSGSGCVRIPSLWARSARVRANWMASMVTRSPEVPWV